jgi:serine phosphatase RsbU (regulator of sigma subunit)/anti-sigma regulatory factor (Ser/Thr protein kinase)
MRVNIPLFKRTKPVERPVEVSVPPPQSQRINAPFEFDPDDPLVAYLQESVGVVDVDEIPLDTPGVRALKKAEVKLVVPLVVQGQLIGVLNLGERQSGVDYNSYDRRMLGSLSTDAASALRVAQLVRQQEVEAQERQRIDQELQIARLIQQTLLPKEPPTLNGWQTAAYYRPAREVGGDFYDLLPLPDGRLGIVIGDVTDKGVPAALVMATTRALMRSTAQQGFSPGVVLSRVNNALVPDMPPRMFVTCLYALLDPKTGKLQFANAGHGAPYRRGASGVEELTARGMPLGILPNREYEEQEATLLPRESVLFYSDGLIEAHNPAGEMLGFPGLQGLLADHPGGTEVIDFLIKALAEFTGEGWDQEDDITLLALHHSGNSPFVAISHRTTQMTPSLSLDMFRDHWVTLNEYVISSELGNERLLLPWIVEAISDLHLSEYRLENLKTAVAEAAMNAMEHGNGYGSGKPITVRVQLSSMAVRIQLVDYGTGLPSPEPPAPNLEAKLAGLESPRGWGLYLIKNLVDEVENSREDGKNITTLTLYR